MTSVSSFFFSKSSPKALRSLLIPPKPPLHTNLKPSLKSLKTLPVSYRMSELCSTVGSNGAAPVAPSNGGDAGRQIRRFVLSSSSHLVIQKGDITKWFVDGASDAIVNAAKESMLGGVGVDGAIHEAAGTDLRSACRDVPEVRRGVRCPTGEARITPAFKLRVSHVIHTVGPIYNDSAADYSKDYLQKAYRNSLSLAKQNNIQYVAFPAISCGTYQYPLEHASRIAISTVKEFASDFKEVHFVLFSDDVYDMWLEKIEKLL